MGKKCLLFLCIYVFTISSYAQTQYDYYEGGNEYGGLNNAINGLKIIIIILLAFIVLFVIAKIYLTIHDIFHNSQTNNTSYEKNPGNKSNLPASQIEKENKESSNNEEQINNHIDYHHEVITIEGNTLYGDYYRKNGKKSSCLFYYGITRIIHNLESDITNKIGLPIIQKCGCCYDGDHINYEDLNFETLQPVKKNLRLFIAGEFDPSKLQLMKIEGIDNLYDEFVIIYDGEGQKQIDISHDEALEIISKQKIK